MFLIRNYNRFIVHSDWGGRNRYAEPKWENFHIHRFRWELQTRVLRFSHRHEAETFILEHPNIFEYFEGWVEEIDLDDWSE